MTPIIPSKSNWIRIDGQVFDVEEASVQLSMGSHATMYISLDILKYPSYSNYFIRLYESAKQFNLTAHKFEAIGSNITQIDIDFNSKMNLSIRADILETKNTQKRREEIIDDILKDETLSTDSDIIK